MKILSTICITFLFSYNIYSQKNYTELVNPFIGTGGHGHTFPGATMPFGMMQLSPDTRLEGWDGCGGYHYSDSTMYGFSHTHLSGTGIADYCDILVMPFVGNVEWDNKKYASKFSHKQEQASPGYYEVQLLKHNIHAALSTSTRSGMHEYTFANNGEGKIILDLKHRDEVLESSLEIVNNYEIKGMRRSRSWAQNQVIYFYIKFENPIAEYGIALNDSLQKNIKSAIGKNIKSYFSFGLNRDKKLRLKIGISGVSCANAKQNLETEIKHFDINKVKSEATNAWNKELGKIEIKGGTKDQQIAFYTALYHSSISPNVYTDVNGDYRGTDLKVHTAKSFTNYSVFSLWDTHRALHPLQTILNRKKTNDWINTFLAQYQQGGMLPIWELSGNETFCMIGYHAVPVIADAYQKGIRNYDTKLALNAMTSYAESNRFGLGQYAKLGFVSNDVDNESASKTVEYAYDDWCIAEYAKWLGNSVVHKKYLQRAQNYKNLFDTRVHHIRGKVQGFWYTPFKASEVNNFFTEGNSWHYSFTAQQDLDGLIKLYGGKEKAAQKLEELFTTKEALSGRDQSDVTGLIGQYAHGNEPSHHMAYLFNYVGKPWRTQEIINKICTEFYPNNPDGLIGNEDCGQMSAWFVLSAMGFYPVTPASGLYAIGTPLFNEVKIHLENGKTFTITAPNKTASSIYITDLKLNNKKYNNSFIKHTDLENGGKLTFDLSDVPNKNFGIKESEMPHTSIDGNNFLTVPYFDMETFKFKTSLPISIKSNDSVAQIFYAINNSNFEKYTKPFTIDSTTIVKMFSQKGTLKTEIVTQKFYKIATDKNIKINSEVNPLYTADGPDALIDGILGTTNWKTGEWQSYYAKDFEAVIDLQKVKPISYVGIHVLQDVSPWIMYPSKVIFETSDDGITYKLLTTVTNTKPRDSKEVETQLLGENVKTSAKYIRLKAITGGLLPTWHESAGNPSHIFIDEVVVK
jgi:predicted alpha-1,2-mannosidase